MAQVVADSHGQLLERSEELHRIRAAIDGVAAGDGRLVIVEGAPGAGKTALVRRARREAAARGLQVLAARGSPLEREFAFGVVRQLLTTAVRGAPDAGGLLAGPARAARDLLLEDVTEDFHGEPGPRLMHGLYWLVMGLAERHPLMVSVDDAHWADDPSLSFLHFLATRLEDLTAAILVATRPAQGESGSDLLEQLELDPLVDVIRPPALSQAAVAEILRETVGPPEPEFTAACHAATGGNPYFVRELARALADDRVRPLAATATEIAAVGPARVARWAIGRLAGLPPAAADLAHAVAVLGDDAELRHAAELAGCGDAVGALAGALVRARVLEDGRPLRFAHPMLRTAIYNAQTAGERASAHRRAAEVLMAAGAAVERVASHLLRSEPARDPDSSRILAEAMERALAQGAPGTAMAYGRRALAEPPPQDAAAGLRLRVADAEILAGETAAAAERLRGALDDAEDREQRAQIVLRLARCVGSGGAFGEAVQLLERELTGSTGESDTSFALEGELLHWVALVPDAAARAPVHLDRYAELPGTTRAQRNLLAQVAAARAWGASSMEDCVQLARRALGGGGMLGPDGLAFQSWSAAISILMMAEHIDEAARLVDGALEQARRAGALTEHGAAALTGASVAMRAGRLGEVETLSRLALELLPRSLTGGVAAGRLAFAVGARGNFDEAEALVARYLPGECTPTPFAMAGVAWRGMLRRLQGRREQSIADFRAAVEVEERAGLYVGGASSMRASLALALATVDTPQARDLAEQDLAYSRSWGARGSIGVSLHALGVVLGGEEGIARMREAVTLLGESPLRLYRVWALLDLGSALRRTGQRQAARGPLRLAADLAVAIGAHLLAEQAGQELRATGARPRRLMLSGVESLTPMERRIADMAADGLSNPEIAQTLFVTRKNVEMHLSRAYSKLDIRSRADLPQALGRDAAA